MTAKGTHLLFSFEGIQISPLVLLRELSLGLVFKVATSPLQ